MLPLRQLGFVAGFTLLVDSAVPPGPQELGEAIWSLDPWQSIDGHFTLAEALDEQLAGLRFLANANALFAGFVLLLGAIGIYVVVATNGRRRAREIGLRMALGALPRDAAALMLGNAARLVALALMLGAMLAYVTSRGLASPWLDVGAASFWMPSVMTALVLLASGLLAAAWPAWRASRIAPMEILRSE